MSKKIIHSHDKEKLKKKWIARYHEMEAKISKLRREWNLFENEAHASYQQWYYSTFAKTLSGIRELTEETLEYKTILSAVDAQMRINSRTKKEAFLFVKDKTTKKEDPFPTEEEYKSYREKESKEFEQTFKRYHGKSGKEEIDSELLKEARSIVNESMRSGRTRSDPFDLLHQLYEKMKKKKERGDEISSDADQDYFQEPEEESFENEEVAIDSSGDYKTIYRKIVRLLHPDRGTEMSREEMQLWSETQNAYKAGDLAALKTILMRIEGNGSVQIHQLESVGEIMEIVISLHCKMEEMNFLKNRVKKEFVCRFWASRSRAKNREKLKIEIEGDLKQQLYFFKMNYVI